MQEGTVILTKGAWGFIQFDDPMQSDIFWHFTTLLDGRKRLIEGERVQFEIGERKGRPIASEVRVIEPMATPQSILSGTAPAVKGAPRVNTK